jgi:hypothetical protein
MNQAGSWRRPETGRHPRGCGFRVVRRPPWMASGWIRGAVRSGVARVTVLGVRVPGHPHAGHDPAGRRGRPDKAVARGSIPRWPTIPPWRSGQRSGLLLQGPSVRIGPGGQGAASSADRAAGFYPACRGFESLAAHRAPLEEADQLTWPSTRRLPVRARHGAHMAQWTNGKSRRPFKPRHLRVRGPSALLRGGQAGKAPAS